MCVSLPISSTMHHTHVLLLHFLLFGLCDSFLVSSLFFTFSFDLFTVFVRFGFPWFVLQNIQNVYSDDLLTEQKSNNNSSSSSRRRRRSTICLVVLHHCVIVSSVMYFAQHTMYLLNALTWMWACMCARAIGDIALFSLDFRRLWHWLYHHHYYYVYIVNMTLYKFDEC